MSEIRRLLLKSVELTGMNISVLFCFVGGWDSSDVVYKMFRLQVMTSGATFGWHIKTEKSNRGLYKMGFCTLRNRVVYESAQHSEWPQGKYCVMKSASASDCPRGLERGGLL